MAQWVRQFPGSFAAGSRFIWTRAQSEWAAWRASIHRIDDAQLLPAIRFDRVHLAHRRSRFERTIDMSNAPSGDLLRWPPGSGEYIGDANMRSIPSMLFVIGSCRFDRTVRLDYAELHLTTTIAMRINYPAARQVVLSQSVPVPPLVPGPHLSAATYPAGWDATLDVRLHRVGEPAFTESADGNFPLTFAPASVQAAAYIADFMTPNLTRFARAPIVGGPIRVSTYEHEAPDPNAMPDRVNRIPLLAAEVGANDLLLVMMRAPRFYRTFTLGGGFIGTCPEFRNVSAVATQGTSIGPAAITIHASAEATT